MSLTEQHPVTKQYPRTVYQDEGSLHMMKSPNCLEMKDRIFTVDSSAARCQVFKFGSISALSNSIFDIIGLARTSQEYHQRFLRTDKNYNFCINFIKMLFNILKIKPIFGDFVNRYRILKLFDAGLSIFSNRFWVHIRCWLDVLNYRAALVDSPTSNLCSSILKKLFNRSIFIPKSLLQWLFPKSSILMQTRRETYNICRVIGVR